MKNYLLRKKKDAVSPVIATILMVAITVVLAAVLYVMVMGFGGGSNNTPSMSFNNQKTASWTQNGTTEYKFTVASVSANSVKFADISIVATPAPGANASVVGPYVFASGLGQTYAAAGDYFIIWMQTGSPYTITVKYAGTGGSMYSVNFVAS